MILDDYDAHHTDEVKAACAEHNVDLRNIQSGQATARTNNPLDVAVYATSKAEGQKAMGRGQATDTRESSTLGGAAERIDKAVRETGRKIIRKGWTESNPLLKGRQKNTRTFHLRYLYYVCTM